jgi:hypothetical protein
VLPETIKNDVNKIRDNRVLIKAAEIVITAKGGFSHERAIKKRNQ